MDPVRYVFVLAARGQDGLIQLDGILGSVVFCLAVFVGISWSLKLRVTWLTVGKNTRLFLSDLQYLQ